MRGSLVQTLRLLVHSDDDVIRARMERGTSFAATHGKGAHRGNPRAWRIGHVGLRAGRAEDAAPEHHEVYHADPASAISAVIASEAK